MQLVLPSYTDGLFSPDTEQTVIPRVKYPFAMNPTPDVYSKVYERDYQIDPSLYSRRIANRTSYTNLLHYSEQLGTATWGFGDTTFSANQATAPDGNATMGKLLEAATTAAHYTFQGSVSPANAQHFIGVFVRGGLGRNYFILDFVDSASATFSVTFNVATAQVFAKSGSVTPYILALGGGDYLYGFFFTPAAGAGNVHLYISSDGSANTYAGDVTKGLYVWGAMMVQSSVRPPYISTTNATRTVSAPDREITVNANARGADPFAYLCDESDPNVITSTVGAIQRKFCRIPNQQTVPGSYLFTAPNFTLSRWASGSLNPPQNSFLIVGGYAVVALLGVLAGFTPTDASMVIVNGYYDIERSITSYTGTPATVIRVPGHNCIIGSVLIYARTISGHVTYIYFTVSGVSGDDLTGVSVTLTDDTINYGTYGFALVLSAADKVRKRTKQTPDYGQTISVSSQRIENYFIAGVSAGITTAADIPGQSPYTLASYLAGLAAGTGWLNVQADAIQPWMGPILAQKYTQAQVADLL